MPAHPEANTGPLLERDRTHVLPLGLRGDAFFNYMVEERTGLPVVLDERTGFHTYAVWEEDEEDQDGGDKGQNEGSDQGATEKGDDDHAQRDHERDDAVVVGGGGGGIGAQATETLSGHVVSGGVITTATAGSVVRRGGREGHFRSSGVRVATFEYGVSSEYGVSASGSSNPPGQPTPSSALKSVLLPNGAKLRTESELGSRLREAAERARGAVLSDEDDDDIGSRGGANADGPLQRHSRPLFSTRSFPGAGSVRSYDTDAVRSMYRGKFAVLVLLIRFADHADRPLPPREDFEVLMNHDGHFPSIVPAGSVRDVYEVNSGGLMDLTGVATDWITLPRNHSYYSGPRKTFGLGHQFKEGVHWAFQQLEDDPDFSFVDAMGDAAPSRGGRGYLASTVFHSGYAAEWGGTDCNSGDDFEHRIWSHMRPMPFESTKEEGIRFHESAIQSGLWGTCGSSVAHVGVVAHEIGHAMGLPDMIGSRPGNGIGNYDMMCNSWGFDGSAHYPPILGAHSKLRMGWLEPTHVKKSARYSVRASHSSLDALRIDYGFPEGEYLLIENRQPESFDGKILGASGQGGIAIWHIDETVDWRSVGGHPWMNISGVPWPQNGAHYNANLLQADGSFDIERQLSHGHVNDLWRTLPDTVFTHVGLTELGPGGIDENGGPFPNTDTYQGGVVKRTGVRIRDFGPPGDEMAVTILLGDEELTPSPSAPPPTTRPNSAPPTTRPTLRPTLVPASVFALRDIYVPLGKVEIGFSNPNDARYDDWIAVYPASIQQLPDGSVPQGVTDWAYTCGTRECLPSAKAASTVTVEGTVLLIATPDVVGIAGAGWTPGTEYRAYLCRNTAAPYRVVARSDTFRLAEAPTARPTQRPTPILTGRPTSAKPTVRPTPSPTKAPSTERPTSPKPTRRPTTGGGSLDGLADGDEPTSAPIRTMSTVKPSSQSVGELDNRAGTSRPSQSPQETGAPTTAAPTSGPTLPSVPIMAEGRTSPASMFQFSWAVLGTSLLAILASLL